MTLHPRTNIGDVTFSPRSPVLHALQVLINRNLRIALAKECSHVLNLILGMQTLKSKPKELSRGVNRTLLLNPVPVLLGPLPKLDRAMRSRIADQPSEVAYLISR
jgi:hypothetical protein